MSKAHPVTRRYVAEVAEHGAAYPHEVELTDDALGSVIGGLLEIPRSAQTDAPPRNLIPGLGSSRGD